MPRRPTRYPFRISVKVTGEMRRDLDQFLKHTTTKSRRFKSLSATVRYMLAKGIEYDGWERNPPSR